MPDIKALRKTRELDYDYDGVIVKVRYMPGAITTEWRETLAALGVEDSEQYYTLLSQVIVDWDLTDGGEKLPVTAKVMRQVLPEPFIVGLALAILEACYPKGTRSEISDAG